MTCLLDLSHELLQGILSEVDGHDLAALNATCRAFNSFVKGNRILCKSVYLRSWDSPAEAEPCWETSVRNLVALKKLLESENLETKREAFEWAAPLITPLLTVKNGKKNTRFLADLFKSQNNIDAFLASSSLFESAGNLTQQPATTSELRQLAAKLHCLYGVPIDCQIPPMLVHEDSDDNSPSPSYSVLWHPDSAAESVQIPTNNYARAVVYDLRRYTEESFWGPFKSDGSQNVDWEKVEAIMVVLGYNMRLFNRRAPHVFEPIWETPFNGASPNSYVSAPPKGLVREPSPPGDLDMQDPYGITGEWMRVVCFLDYHDLFAFNFLHSVPADQPRDPINTREAIRIIRLKLRVSAIEPPGPEDGQDYPVVSFTGTSWSLHASWDANANSQIRERWRSEGIQVGGIRSGRGVLGNWFDKDFDRHGPAGPTAFWKVSDYIEDKDAEEGAPDDASLGDDDSDGDTEYMSD
ncbi:hypothetical protein D6D25_07586 [Aureobasidium pullulans]|nr:hypothetical protein D6D25_07586 [Aureobasidium pullulans]